MDLRMRQHRSLPRVLFACALAGMLAACSGLGNALLGNQVAFTAPQLQMQLDRRFPRHQEASDWLRDHGPALRVSRPAASRFTGTPVVEEQPQPTQEPAFGLGLRRPRRKRGAAPSDDQISLFGQ